MLPIVELLQSLNAVGEFEFSIDYFNGLSFEPTALWSLFHLSIKTALFLAIILARKTGEILAFSGAFWILIVSGNYTSIVCFSDLTHPWKVDTLTDLSLEGYLPFGRLQLISTMEVVLECKPQDPKTSH